MTGSEAKGTLMCNVRLMCLHVKMGDFGKKCLWLHKEVREARREGEEGRGGEVGRVRESRKEGEEWDTNSTWNRTRFMHEDLAASSRLLKKNWFLPQIWCVQTFVPLTKWPPTTFKSR